MLIAAMVKKEFYLQIGRKPYLLVRSATRQQHDGSLSLSHAELSVAEPAGQAEMIHAVRDRITKLQWINWLGN
jgi:hypothetical protein